MIDVWRRIDFWLDTEIGGLTTWMLISIAFWVIVDLIADRRQRRARRK